MYKCLAMGSPPQPPTPSSFSSFGPIVTLLAAAPPGRDGSTADSFPFDDNRDEKQNEGILEIIKISDVGSEKAARHDETCLAQVADEEECSEHNLRTFARPVLDFLSVLKGGAQEGRSEHNHLDRILDSGAGMHATGNLRLLSEFTRAPGGSSAAVYHTRDGKDLRIAGAGRFSPIDADVIAAFYNSKLILKRIEEFKKQRVEICPPRWLAPFASSPTNPGGVAELETSLLLDSGASIHVVGDAKLLTGIQPSSFDKWVVCADGTRLPKVGTGASIRAIDEARLLRSIELFSIDKWAVLPDDTLGGTGTLQMDGRFRIPDVRYVDGLKKNLISVSQLDKEGRSEHNHPDLILDSGTSMHATGNLRLLSEFTRAPGGSSVAVYHTRDGKDLRIAGTGKIACYKFHLAHVHYVPELGSRFTLASVQLLVGCGYGVMFCGGWCYVKNRNNGSLVGRGRMHDEDGLYHLEYLRIPLALVDGAY